MAGKSTLPGIAQGLPTRREAEVRAPARAASMGPAPRFLSPPQPPAPGKKLPVSDSRPLLTFATVSI